MILFWVPMDRASALGRIAGLEQASQQWKEVENDRASLASTASWLTHQNMVWPLIAVPYNYSDMTKREKTALSIEQQRRARAQAAHARQQQQRLDLLIRQTIAEDLAPTMVRKNARSRRAKTTRRRARKKSSVRGKLPKNCVRCS